VRHYREGTSGRAVPNLVGVKRKALPSYEAFLEQRAERIRYLLRYPEEAGRIAEAGHQVVRRRFLMPRLLRDELRLLHALVDRPEARRLQERAPA
jgi:hypothetical protein